LYRLNVPLGTSFLDGCGGINPRVLQDTFSIQSIIGNNGPFFVRKYHLEGLAQNDTYIARKFQMYYRFNYEGGNTENLVGAIIDSIIYGSISGISNKNSGIPTCLNLYQNFPNPFNPKTVIKLQLPEYSLIKLTVFDVIGRAVKILYEGYLRPGQYQFEFDGTDLASGVYFYKLQSKNYIRTKKMLLIK
jgi:hypothetical protein